MNIIGRSNFVLVVELLGVVWRAVSSPVAEVADNWKSGAVIAELPDAVVVVLPILDAPRAPSLLVPVGIFVAWSQHYSCRHFAEFASR